MVKRISSRLFISCAAILSLSLPALADYYVTSGPDSFDGKIYRLSDDGTFESMFGTSMQPIGMALLDNDTFIVCDYGNHSLRLFHADGTDFGVFASDVDANAVLVDSYGNILVSEYITGLVRRFSPSGVDLGVFASTGLSRQGQLAMDTAGNIYTSSFFPGESTIYRYDPDGNFMGVFSDINQSGIPSPTGLAFRSDGSMLVSNTGHNTLDLLDTNGDLISNFAVTGMFEPEWLTVEPDDSVLLPSWSGGWIEKYDSVGNDLGIFASVPNCYQILRGPDVVTPSAAQAVRGRVNLGNSNSLAETDGDVLQVCRFFVVNATEPPIQIDVTGTTSVTSPSAFSVALTSNMANSGSFQQQLILVDKNGIQSPTERRFDSLGVAQKLVRLQVAGDPTNFVKPDGTVKVRINVRAIGPTATIGWCYNADRLAWTVRP